MLNNRGCWPHFLLAGFQKCGTTTLFHWLREHPQIRPPLKKEIQYFDKQYCRPERWYRGYFPSKGELGEKDITGEASTDYIFHPFAMERIAKAPFKPKIILILRDPVKRAISQYQHYKRLGYETLSMPMALEAEEQRLADCKRKIQRHPKKLNEADYNYIRFSYAQKGLYAQHLERLWQHFPSRRTHILFLEELQAEPVQEIRNVCRFLDIEDSFVPVNVAPRNMGKYPAVEPEVLQYLQDFYREPNQRLQKLLGKTLPFENL